MNHLELPSTSGIYAIRFGGKEYVGASENIKKRMIGHFSELNRGCHSVEEMQYDFTISMGDTFYCLVLIECPISDLKEEENKAMLNTEYKLYNKSTKSNKPTKPSKKRKPPHVGLVMKELQQEFIELMAKADMYRGMLTKIYSLGEFSSDYLRKVKRGEQNFDNTKPNKKKVKSLINALKKEIDKKQELLTA